MKLDLFKKKPKPVVTVVPQTPRLSLEDVLAPSEIEADFNEIRIGETFYKTYFMSSYPRFIEPNWLEPLISFDHSLMISMFVYPNKSKGVLDDLKRKIAEMEATIQTDVERGRIIDPSVQLALDDSRSLQEQLVKGAERFFQFSLYVSVPAKDKEELNNVSKLVESTLGSLSINAKPATLQMEDGFRSCLPLGEDLLMMPHNMDTTSLATTFPFTSSELTANEGIMYGINEHNGSLILFDRFTLENANSVIFAKSGAGKSVKADETVLIQDAQGTRLIPIGQLVDGFIDQKGINFRDEELEGVTNPGIKVFAFNEQLKTSWSPVSIAARKLAPKDFYTIKTSSGRHMTVTGDHNLVILRGAQVVNVKSSEVIEGDVIPIPRRIAESENPINYLDTFNLIQAAGFKPVRFMTGSGYRIGSKYRRIKTSLPVKISITNQFAQLLGYITSEGFIGQNHTVISNLDLEVLENIQNALEELGISFFMVKRNQTVSSINITAHIFTELLHAIGANGRSGEKRVPGFLFNCSKKIISRYLRAYFEDDGTVGQHEVSACTKSAKLASDLSYLLLQFGIIARIKETNKRAVNVKGSIKQPFYQITISGHKNLKNFSETIGFDTDRKNNKLTHLLETGIIPNTNIDTIPGIEPILDKVFKVLYDSPLIPSPTNFSAIRRGAFSPSPETLDNLINQIETRISGLLTITASRISYLRSLPSQTLLIESGKLIPQVNTLLWQELGDSWRLAKNGLVTMGTGNALRATSVIFNETYNLDRIRKEVIAAFAELNLSLERFDPSLWNYLRYRASSRGSYERLTQAIDYLKTQYETKLNEINELQNKISLLKNLANSDLFWDPITKIDKKPCQDQYVYDLTVDNQVFLAGFGGMFVHNSYFVKLEVLRSLMMGTEILVIDPEQEYLSLCQAVGGQYINFSINSPVKINPFDMSAVTVEGENELGRKILSLTAFLKLVLGSLEPTEAAVLDRALKQTYRLRGITDDPKTQTNPHSGFPLMEDLYKVLVGMEEKNALDLAARLERFVSGSLAGIFSSPSNIQLTNSFTVFSVRDLEDQLRPLAMYMILEHIWTKIRSSLRKRILVVDEAWYMMRQEDSANFLVDIAKRARKYYLGVTTITQDVEDFLGGDRGKEIISNSSIQILLKQAPASIGHIGEVFNLSQGERRLLLSAGVGQGLFFAGNTHVAMSVLASPEEHKLITSNPEELLARLQQKLPSY